MAPSITTNHKDGDGSVSVDVTVIGNGTASSKNIVDNGNSNNNKSVASVRPPKSMVEALEWDDPHEALLLLSKASHEKATSLSKELVETHLKEIASTTLSASELPEILRRLPNLNDVDSHPVSTAIACSDSILHSLTKIASGGSQASQEIKQLEQEKRELEEHAQDVETALILRKASDVAAQSLSAQRYEPAAAAIRDYLYLCGKKATKNDDDNNDNDYDDQDDQEEESKLTDRAKAYAGEYTIAQLESTQAAFKTTLLEDYQKAVEQANLQSLGKLTPLVQMVQLESEAVALYLRFLKEILSQELEKAVATQSSGDNKKNAKQTPPYTPMARVYNAAFTILRHHLPMVSHCLHRAKGDAAVVQLVHVQVEEAVKPLFRSYIQSRQLAHCSAQAQMIYGMLEERYRSGGDSIGTDVDVDDIDDCGFSQQVGSLADVDASMEEAALCLQHAESYTRFLQHTVSEINKARRLRFEQEQEAKRIERERREWTSGLSSSSSSKNNNNDNNTSSSSTGAGGSGSGGAAAELTRGKTPVYKPLEILPAHTQLQETLAEVGGYYSVIERCLLMASMQRAFSISPDDLRQYSPIATKGNTPAVASRALQTTIVESCLYAARRGTQRAFATGHTGTASAVANFLSDSLRGVLVEYLMRRAEDLGVSALKPGEGLIEGSAGIFAASTLIRQGQTVSHAVGASKMTDEAMRRQEIEQGIAIACASLNDLDVAAQHTLELESILSTSVEKGFPPNTHETEQLLMCVKGLSPVAEIFKMAATNSVESLVSVLKPRIRAIVTDAVGGDGSGTAGGFSVMGTAKPTDRHTVRMNYNLDEDAYQLLEVSEGYISRLCTCLDELLLPLCAHLAPRLSDELVLETISTVCKRLEVSLKKCRFTALGALSLDSDMRDLLNYAKERLDSYEYSSNVALYRACTPLARMLQIAKLLNVDDLEDVLDLINASKRKGNWDLKLDDAKSYLSLRVDFESSKIDELLRIPDDN